mmetsp:Transcript_14267/g.33333  ORF Transcript_14267/g.33333 Transcript_14267/m.33333 type:complete len:200 (+) Transcript_14267:5272-5871(+)
MPQGHGGIQRVCRVHRSGEALPDPRQAQQRRRVPRDSPPDSEAGRLSAHQPRGDLPARRDDQRRVRPARDRQGLAARVESSPALPLLQAEVPRTQPSPQGRVLRRGPAGRHQDRRPHRHAAVPVPPWQHQGGRPLHHRGRRASRRSADLHPQARSHVPAGRLLARGQVRVPCSHCPRLVRAGCLVRERSLHSVHRLRAG